MSDVRSDILTEDTSAYGTLTSPPSQASSRRTSVTSINSESSGVSSLAPLEQRSSLYHSMDLEGEAAKAESINQELKQAESSSSASVMKKPVGS